VNEVGDGQSEPVPMRHKLSEGLARDDLWCAAGQGQGAHEPNREYFDAIRLERSIPPTVTHREA
jgi:hypothetical protein